jgi:cyclic pyranopterin monophosphate synthase
MSDKFSHIDAAGNPMMVDVGTKAVTARSATAQCRIALPPEILDLLQDDEIQTKKGPVFQTAIIAGVMAAKRTSDLIPLCHPLSLEDCQIAISVDDKREVRVRCTVKLHGKTGVEMEALTGASIAALTIYDMCKALSHDITIGDLKLISKSGGNHDFDRTS